MATDVKEEARLLKEEGNTAFKNKRYYTAVEKYSKSLEVFTDPVVLSNRAQAELNTNLNILAQIDCTAAIELDPSNVKCYYRRAQALRALGLFELAFKDANKCLELSKTDKSMQKLVDELRGKKNVAVLETCPIRRDDYIQSQEKFTDVEIEFADVSNAELKKEENKVHVKTTKQIPFIPKDYQDFVAGVTYLKDDSMLLAEYFLRIEPSLYNRLFDDLLDNENAALVMDALLKRLKEGFPIDKLAERLILISGLSRFELVIALMSDKDREIIKAISEYLTPEDAAIVRIKYDF